MLEHPSDEVMPDTLGTSHMEARTQRSGCARLGVFPTTANFASGVGVKDKLRHRATAVVWPARIRTWCNAFDHAHVKNARRTTEVEVENISAPCRGGSAARHAAEVLRAAANGGSGATDTDHAASATKTAPSPAHVLDRAAAQALHRRTADASAANGPSEHLSVHGAGSLLRHRVGGHLALPAVLVAAANGQLLLLLLDLLLAQPLLLLEEELLLLLL